MANQTITQLPAAGAITGTELVPIVQNGGTYHTTTAAIANSPTQTQTFLTVNNEPTLNNSRYFSTDANFTLSDGGAQSFLRLNLTGAAASLASSGNGIQVKTSLTTVTGRTLTSGTSGLSIANGDGVSGNPTFSLTGNVLSLANASGTGLLVLTGPSALTFRSIQGTANEIDVADATGVSGNPTIGIADNPILPGTGATIVPKGTTAQQPAGVQGQFRYNTDTAAFEGYTSSGWGTFSTAGGVASFSAGSTGFSPSSPTAGNIVLSGTLNVANGGTGAVSLTGYVKGSGTSAFTASATVPTTDLSGQVTNAQLQNSAITINGNSVSLGGSTTVTAATPNAATFTNTGGASPGVTFDGSAARIIDYSTVGAPKADGTGASGTWNISILGNAATATSATSATTATTATTATNIAGGAAGSIPYQTAGGTTAMLATSSGVLVGGTTPSYSTAPTLTGTNFSSIPNGALQNSSITLGTTSVSLGGTTLTLGGLTSVAVTQNPTTALQVATKQYVDGLVSSGITYHTPVKYEVPTGNLNAIYNQPGGAGVGVGATLTNNGTLAAFAPDGPTASPGDRILIYNQTNAFENGVYTVTTVGDGSTAWVLTRATDADTYALKSTTSLGEGDAFFVTSGNTGAGETYVCNTSGTITFGTTSITFVQVSSAQIYSAGTGLTLTGTQFSLTAPVMAALGGTGQTSYTAGDLIYASGSTTLSKLGIGTASYVLTSSGSAPQWSDPGSIAIGTATNAVNIGITNDDTTNATMYPVWVTANTGNLPAKVTSTKLSFNPSTGALTATGGISGGTF